VTEDAAAHSQTIRQIDPDFRDDEKLFIRVNPAYQPAELDTALLNNIRFPAFSVNRGKYSVALDLLSFPQHIGWNVGAFSVSDVPKSVPASNEPGAANYLFSCVHCPENGNYAHAEVRSYNESGEHKKPSNTAKLDFRERLRQRVTFVIRNATV